MPDCMPAHMVNRSYMVVSCCMLYKPFQKLFIQLYNIPYHTIIMLYVVYSCISHINYTSTIPVPAPAGHRPCRAPSVKRSVSFSEPTDSPGETGSDHNELGAQHGMDMASWMGKGIYYICDIWYLCHNSATWFGLGLKCLNGEFNNVQHMEMYHD